MSTALLTQALAFVRAQFTRQELATVQAYGGEFSSDEIDKIGFNCPAVFITVLGWDGATGSKQLSGRYARKLRMAAFVVCKAPKRETRMLGAMQIADKLALLLRDWEPANASTNPYTLGAIEDEPSCENLYTRAVDQLGLAVWLVRWEQCVKPEAGVAQLVDWLRVDIEDTVRSTEPEPAPAPVLPDLVVTEAIVFAPVP